MITKDINRIGGVIASVNELIKLNLLQAFTDEPIFYVYPSCIQIKDAKYMRNWCQNILRVWSLTYAEKLEIMSGKLKPGEQLNIELLLYSRENGDSLCRYSELNGLSYV